MINEDNEISIVSLGEAKSKQHGVDVFMKDVRSVVGIDRNTKRRIRNRIEKRLEGATGAKSKQIDDDYYTSYDAFELEVPPYDMKYLAKLYEISAYNYAAVNAKAANVVGLGYEFVESFAAKRAMEETTSERKRAKMRKNIELIKNELSSKLDELNKEKLFIESIQAAYIDYEATGCGYIEIARNADGTIGYVGNIPSQSMRVRSERDGFVQLVGNRAVFFRNYGDLDTPDPISGQDSPNEIIQLKKYSPSNSYYGVPDIISALNAVAGNEFASKFNLDYFEHRAAPRYIITLKGAKLSEASEKRLLEFLQSNIKGKNHRSLFIPLPADGPDGNKSEFKMMPIENGVQDASFENYRKANRDEILMAHRVPITKIGISDGASVALAKDADKTFKEQVCLPEQRILSKKINAIIREFTNLVEIKFNELTLTDEDTQSRIDERYLRMQVIVPNEVRARKGMQALPDGDSVIELNSQQKAEQTAQASGNRERDQQRAANNPDSSPSISRNPKGDGRQQG